MNDSKIELEGLVSGDELDTTYLRRNKKFIYKKVGPEDLSSSMDEGWEKVGTKGKNQISMRKSKETGPGFEDEVWCIFKRLGFSEMNKTNSFEIQRFGTNLTKQIDVFAKDEQCICLIECKAADQPHTRRGLDKDIDQIAGFHYEIEQSIFSHYNSHKNKKKIKIIWILATKNIDVSENDYERAHQAKVKILEYRDIDYYSQLSTHFGDAAKYQFLADMLPGIEIPGLLEPIPALRGQMGKNTFYSFVMEPEKLLKIAYIAHRGKSGEESIKTYQRMATKSRLTKIAKYIQEDNGMFPTSIVINIDSERPLRFDVAEEMAGKNAVLGKLYIPSRYKTAWIIDGQHRLFAYAGLDEATSATLPVIAFENLDPEVQANLFIEINGEQVRVPKGHLIDLWATLHWNGKYGTERLRAQASRLVKELSIYKQSPLRDRIVEIGKSRTETCNITLASVTEEIQKRKLLGSTISQKSKDINPGPLTANTVDQTISRARDVICGYINNYLRDESIKKQWDMGKEGYICTNGGLIALIRVMDSILWQLEYVDHLPIRKMKASELVTNIWKYQEPVYKYLSSMSPKEINDFREQNGEGGFRTCTFALLKKVNDEFNTFEPPGLRQWINEQNTENNPRAFEILNDIQTMVINYVVDALKNEYGEDISCWWHQGIPAKIRSAASNEAQKKGEYHNPERYVPFVAWMDVISKNFDLFGETLTIDAKQNDNRKKKLAWMMDVEEIRKIVTQPPRGGVSDRQLDFLKRIEDTLNLQLQKDNILGES